MHLCTCVSEEGGNEEGAGSEALSLLSLDTHRREVAGAHGTLPTDVRRKPKSIAPKKQRTCSGLETAAAGGPESLLQPAARKNP